MGPLAERWTDVGEWNDEQNHSSLVRFEMNRAKTGVYLSLVSLQYAIAKVIGMKVFGS